jgi:streptogramin lyase
LKIPVLSIIQPKNGLSNNVIQSIREDREGNIWVSTEGGAGISKFNPENERFENFNFSNGNIAACIMKRPVGKHKTEV